MNLSSPFLEYFLAFEDPRLDNHNRSYKLYDISIIAILGTICGADRWIEIYDFALNKID